MMMTKASVISAWLRKAWEEWDVRILVLLSLLLQAILLILGKRRKYTNSALCRNILWVAYLSADWVAIAALGKLSTATEVSAPSFTLRSLWAPLLLLHLGGADTITSYDFEDSQIWSRHLLTLTLKSVLAVYVIYLSWTKLLWISVLSFPLMVAGIIKYVERILCLHFSYSGKAGRALQLKDANIPPASYANLSDKVDTLVVAFTWFAAMRPDVNNYLSIKSTGERIQTYLSRKGIAVNDVSTFIDMLDALLVGDKLDVYLLATIQLGFMFDVVHTKAAIIYTKVGGILRLLSFCGTFCVLMLFLVRLTDVSKYHLSTIDTFVTSVLLVGSVALEFYAAWLIISSDWAWLLMLKYRCSIPSVVQYFVSFHWITQILELLVEKKRWVNHVGQLDLVNYCLSRRSQKKRKPALIFRVLDDLRERWNIAGYKAIPNELKNQEFVAFLKDCISFNTDSSISFPNSRGLMTLKEYGYHEKLASTVQLDFDQSIIVWHIATKVLYELDQGSLNLHIQGDQEEQVRCPITELKPEDKTKMEFSKRISDYMMYLLVLRPSMVLPEYSKNFWLDIWLDNTRDYLKKLFNDKLQPQNHDTSDAVNLLLHYWEDLPTGVDEFREKDSLHRDKTVEKVLEVIEQLRTSDWKWKLIQSVWKEMIVYAAAKCQHINHIHQLQKGSELLTVIWLMENLLNLLDNLSENLGFLEFS